MTRAYPELLIGTSGWSYDHWSGPFYPEHLPSRERLPYYAERFRSVEINNAFYQLPDENTLRHWRDAVPRDFVFTVKASRYITHMKKLKDPAHSVSNFFHRISVLDDRLGPILFQLPPRWRFNPGRLGDFLDALGGGFRYAFEFRDPSWLNQEAFDLLAQHGAALCIYELDGFLSPKEITADFVYLRLHGPEGAYRGSYDQQTLSGWAGAFSQWRGQGRDLYCYFDNDQAGYAALNALSLRSMMDRGVEGDR